MKIKIEQLARSLKSADPALVWLSGDEPLLIQEAADRTRAYFRDQGYLEREIFNVDRHFDWEQFLQANDNLSLFGDRKLLDVRLGPSKLDEAGKKALQHYCDTADDNLRLMISGPRIEKSTLNTKWFKAIEGNNLLVQIWPVDRAGLVPWLEQRLLRENLRADAEALQLLVDRVEGNLLAATQEIEKLKLLAGGNDGAPVQLDAATVLRLVADNSRFSPYQLVDAALLGDLARAHKILAGLRGEGVFPLLILSAICRELRALLTMLEKKEQGQGINAILQTQRVFFNRKQAVGNALRRLDTATVWALLEQGRLVDQSVKGMNSLNPWDELGSMLASLAGKPLYARG